MPTGKCLLGSSRCSLKVVLVLVYSVFLPWELWKQLEVGTAPVSLLPVLQQVPPSPAAPVAVTKGKQ